jgi:hypothetical protein
LGARIILPGIFGSSNELPASKGTGRKTDTTDTRALEWKDGAKKKAMER